VEEKIKALEGVILQSDEILEELSRSMVSFEQSCILSNEDELE
jgi:hypothetical protein